MNRVKMKMSRLWDMPPYFVSLFFFSISFSSFSLMFWITLFLRRKKLILPFHALEMSDIELSVPLVFFFVFRYSVVVVVIWNSFWDTLGYLSNETRNYGEKKKKTEFSLITETIKLKSKQQHEMKAWIKFALVVVFFFGISFK